MSSKIICKSLEGDAPWRPLRLWPSRLQLLSHRCASYLPVHRCLGITKKIT
jgi:hypothetical protein